MVFLTMNVITEKLATSPCECILLGCEGVMLSLVQVQEVHVASYLPTGRISTSNCFLTSDCDLHPRRNNFSIHCDLADRLFLRIRKSRWNMGRRNSNVGIMLAC